MARTIQNNSQQIGPTLGYAPISSNFASAATSQTQVTGLSVTVTVPSGGRRVKVTVYAPYFYNSGANYVELGIWRGTVGTGTQIGWAGANSTLPRNIVGLAIDAPTAGTYTYNIGMSSTAGTGTLEASSARPAFLLVELI